MTVVKGGNLDLKFVFVKIEKKKKRREEENVMIYDLLDLEY